MGRAVIVGRMLAQAGAGLAGWGGGPLGRLGDFVVGGVTMGSAGEWVTGLTACTNGRASVCVEEGGQTDKATLGRPFSEEQALGGLQAHV